MYHISFYDKQFDSSYIYCNIFCEHSQQYTSLISINDNDNEYLSYLKCLRCNRSIDLTHNENDEYFREMHDYSKHVLIHRNNCIYYTKNRTDAITFIKNIKNKHVYKYLRKHNKFDKNIK